MDKPESNGASPGHMLRHYVYLFSRPEVEGFTVNPVIGWIEVNPTCFIAPIKEAHQRIGVASIDPNTGQVLLGFEKVNRNRGTGPRLKHPLNDLDACGF